MLLLNQIDCFPSEHYILLTVSIRRVKFRTRFSNQLPTRRRIVHNKPDQASMAGAVVISKLFHLEHRDQFGTDPPQPQGWGVLGIPGSRILSWYHPTSSGSTRYWLHKGTALSLCSFHRRTLYKPCFSNPSSPCSAPRRSPSHTSSWFYTPTVPEPTTWGILL